MINNLHIIQVHVRDGVMNTGASFWGDVFQKKKSRLSKRRIILGNQLDFNGKLMFMADQKTNDGSYKIVDEELMPNNPNGGADIKEDILVIGQDMTGVAIGYPVADCPVLVVTDVLKGVTAFSHCSAAMVDMKLPKLTVDVLGYAYNCKLSSIYAYITASVGPNWTYDSWPKWALDSNVWQDCIIQKEDLFYIDIKKVMIKQLNEISITGYLMNNDDIITDPRYFSNSVSSKWDEDKKDLRFAGVFYK